ncbi:MAG: 2Fe-2S iron-sulfur cluster-binding protein, partial [Thermoproteota archaeon]|nr:2Fe-2S iron-sulfur cluster-binding protein [Thermoproteota archaeon]
MTEQLIEKIETVEKKHEKEKKHQREKEYPKSSVTLKIYRANRRAGESSHYDRIEVPVQRWTTVLDALLYAKAYKDPSIGIRYSCRMASCGSCGMKINGIPRLACYTK